MVAGLSKKLRSFEGDRLMDGCCEAFHTMGFIFWEMKANKYRFERTAFFIETSM